MPQPFVQAALTNSGANILTRAQAGEGKIAFTRMVIGDGSYTDVEKDITALQKMTELKSPKNSFLVSKISKVNDATVRVTALITNMDPETQKAIITTAFNINEIGLYAKIEEDDSDVLYSVTVTAGSEGDLMPPYNGESPAQITQSWDTSVSNTDNVTFTLPSGALALASDLAETNNKLDQMQHDMSSLITDKVAELEESVSVNSSNILALDIAFAVQIGASVSGMSGNIAVETFATDDDFRIESGIYDSENKRIYA